MTPEELAAAVGTPINLFGTTWMFDLGNFAPAQAAGYGVLDLYVTGRAGVNGAIASEEVVVRGGLHLNALGEVGLPAIEAVVYRAGPNMAMLFGHQPPLPEVTEDTKARWRRAEDRTNEMIAPAFAALSESERERFAQLVDELLVAELPG